MKNSTTEEKYRAIMGKLMSIMRDHKSVVDWFVNETKLHKSQHRLLMNLARLGNNVSQRDLAETLNITPAAVAVTLKKLEKNGLVGRKMAEKDNRYNEVILTEKGKKIVKESYKVFKYADEKMFDGFSKEELDAFEGYLNRIKDNLSKKMEE
ncbi:MAG: MarR family transcriptional regulator [Firmicutes bacterium]|nr:MarR family transcriptional regulator [Bacillota bacterium]